MKAHNLNSCGLSLAELLVSVAISAITLPLILNLVIEPLLAQLKSSALADAEGNAKLLALRVAKGQTLTYRDSNTVMLDGNPLNAPEGCTFFEPEANAIEVRCRAGASDTVAHTSTIPLLTKDPCGSADLFPLVVPNAATCRQAMRKRS